MKYINNLKQITDKYKYDWFIYIITIGIIFTHCKKEEIQLIQTKTMVNDTAVYFSNDAGKTFIKALYIQGIYYGNVEQGLYYSTNKGGSWMLSNVNQKIDSIWFVANIFIAQGKSGLFGSTNGQQFTNIPIQATIKAVTTTNNLIILFTNKGVFTATNLQNINPTNITDSVQTNVKINNTILVGTAKGLYYYNGNNFTLTNLQKSTSYIYTNNGLIFAQTDSLYFSTNATEFKKVITLQNIYFANTNDSLYYSSNSGITWLKSNIGQVDGVTYKDNFFEALATNGKKYYSSDGALWTFGIFLIGTANNNGVESIWYSRNGKNYIKSNFFKNNNQISAPGPINQILFNGNKYLAIVLTNFVEGIGFSNSEIYYSENGANWFNSNIGNKKCSVSVFKGTYYLTNNEEVYKSLNGIDWQKITLNGEANFYNLVGIINDKLHILNQGCIFPNCFYGKLFYSSDGNTFNSTNNKLMLFPNIYATNNNVTLFTNNSSNSGLSALDNNNFVNVNTNNTDIVKKLYYLKDKWYYLVDTIIENENKRFTFMFYGTDYTNLNKYFQKVYIASIGYVHDKFFMLTTNDWGRGTCYDCFGLLYYSYDGINWLPTNIKMHTLSEIEKHIKYYNGNWVGIKNADLTVSLSKDGINWTMNNQNLNLFGDIYIFNNTFFAKDPLNIAAGRLFYSNNGENWIRTDLPNNQLGDLYFFE